MTTKLLEFKKTEHFLFSQWKRGIDDQKLYKILPFVELSQSEKDVLIIMPSFLNKKGIGLDEKQCLILIVKDKMLITGYWCSKPNYIFNKKERFHLQIIY